MNNPTCANCKFSKSMPAFSPITGEESEELYCRRYPPQVSVDYRGIHDGSASSNYPGVEETDYCGEWASANKNSVSIGIVNVSISPDPFPLDSLRPCPFCGSGNLSVTTNDHSDYVWYMCGDCQAEGPPGEKSTEAWRLWNIRKPEVPNV